MTTVVHNHNVLGSTAYYRRNKLDRTKVHKCSHCDYETTGPKSCLTAHILAKHTDKKELPFSCIYCDKKFVQKQNCITHIERHHPNEAERDNIFESEMYRKKDATYQFVISQGKYKPTSVKTRDRYNFYMSKKVIKKSDFAREDFKEKGITLTKLKYDITSEYICVKEMTLKESREKFETSVCINNTPKKKVRKLKKVRIVVR